jgi:mono/diheme cytochrome c family protein
MTTMMARLLPMIVAVLFVTELPARAQTASAPPGNAEKGKKLFVERACWQCHGLAAHGGGIAGPRLAGRVPPWPAFSRYVRRPTEEMIPYTEKALPDAELADIYAWLRAIPPPPAISSIPQLNRK